jgi:tRNA pseudouridine65 synthase
MMVLPDDRDASRSPARMLDAIESGSNTPKAGLACAAPAERLPILYQDEDVVVVDKPSGLLVHRSIIDRHERRFAVQMLRNQLGRRVYPAHRLDKGTSGALAFALDRVSAATLATQFASGEVRKRYVAIVRGWPDAEGLIDHPLEPVHDDVLLGRTGDARDSRTVFRTLETVEVPHRVDRYPTSRYALVELEPLTGRRHQLRRHLAHASHPIVGDSTYGKGRHNRLFRDVYRSQRLLLACTQLSFRHPRTGEPCTVDAPLAVEFAAVLRQLGWPAR